jgi:hypothetical protein
MGNRPADLSGAADNKDRIHGSSFSQHEDDGFTR